MSLPGFRWSRSPMGGLRQAWYGKHLAELQAHQFSTLTAVVLFGVYIGFVVRVWRPVSATQANEQTYVKGLLGEE